MGTSEFYRIVDEFPEVVSSLVVDTSSLGKEGKLLLFLALSEDTLLDDALIVKLRTRLKSTLSPRHVPDEILAVPEVPRTLNGKKLEVPIKRILSGTPVEQAISKDAMADPRVLDPFVERAAS